MKLKDIQLRFDNKFNFFGYNKPLEEYIKNTQKHRDNGDPNYVIDMGDWKAYDVKYKNRLHNLKGPAVIYHEDKEIKYFIGGRQYDIKKYKEKINELINLKIVSREDVIIPEEDNNE